MRLYVANCTRQNWQVHYRLDFNNKGEPEDNRRFRPAKQQDIPPGRQVQLGGDMHVSQVEDIIQQLTKFGLVGCVDVPRLRAAGDARPVPLVFQLDKPVPPDVMRRVHHNNSAILIEQGKLRRQRAAVAVNDLMQNKVSDQFMAAGFDEPVTDKIEVAFEQLDQSEAGESRIEEGYKVRKDAPQAKGKNRSGRRR